MTDWHPIETAPKDGSEILVPVKGRTRIGFWYTGPHPAFSMGAEADTKKGLYPRWAYWPTSDARSEFHGHDWCEPEVWTPLPTPPALME